METVRTKANQVDTAGPRDNHPPLGANDHGTQAAPQDLNRGHHDRFPHPDPLPAEGKGDQDRRRRDFHGKGGWLEQADPPYQTASRLRRAGCVIGLAALIVPLTGECAPGERRLQVTSESEMEASWLMDVGKRHEYGVGVPQDMDRAIMSYCDAAQGGHAEAMYHLGWVYSTGRADKVDEVLAAAWFLSAARLKHQQARQQIQKLGAEGVELDQNPECVLKEAMVERKIPRSGALRKVSTGQRTMVRGLDRRDIKALARRLAPDYGLDPELVLAVIQAESNFNPRARSSKNAQGLMQLIPATASRFGVRDAWDPIDNMRGGMSYLRWLLDRFNGDVKLALAGYNAGENAVERHGGVPPYRETQGYVKRIRKILGGNFNGASMTIPRTTDLSKDPASGPTGSSSNLHGGTRIANPS